ncbi:MAG: DUF488 domain-containing protein [Chloroflexi bacterium]|nr:DUF488 domain-containing protein [Chloroflexota bacterium]
MYTIGHSNHSLQDFIKLLRQHNITAIADVRSSPFSRRNPQFNQTALSSALTQAGIAYVFLGKELGGRPDDPGCYDNGSADFSRIAERTVFKEGITRLLRGIDKYRIALLCAEREPLDCHRTILVCRELRRLGLPIKHILADGCLEDHQETERRLVRTLGLEPNLFDRRLTEEDRTEEAYNRRSKEIAYRSEAEEFNHDHSR